MNIRKNIRYAGIITGLTAMCIAGHLSARENVVSATHHKNALKATTAAKCQPAVSAIDLDINNVRARLMTGGDMWWNIGEGVAAYELPKGSGKSSQFAASCWIGGIDQQGQLKVAAQTYRQDGNDYWPGALDVGGTITSDECANWDMFWKVDRSTINEFIQLSKTHGTTKGVAAYNVIYNWPATGNTGEYGTGVIGSNGTALSMAPGLSYAPFVDLNGNGVYEPSKGEYPDINGDEYIWWVFNDAGNVKLQSLTAAIGVEVQTSGFSYATQDFLNDASFYNYRVINRGSLTIDSTYIAVWDDCDLGYYYDDFIGCDTTRGLGIQYNGTNCDGCSAGNPVNSYGGNPPQVGLDYFKGPLRNAIVNGKDSIEQLKMTNFTYYNNDFSVIGNPTNGVQIYYYMTGSITTGQRFSDDFQGPGIPTKGYGLGPVSNFVFWGDPGDNTQWSECACHNNPGDRRFIFSSGPFVLVPGAINDITFGCVWAQGVGGCGATSFKTIKNIDDQAQALFDDNFKTVEGPQAPRLVVKELDRKLIFYMVNDFGSNNYGENYGRTDGTYKDSLQYHQIVTKAKDESTDTLYHFEGYRVFQLANSQVTSADIFDPNTGEVNNAKAYEVFQCDVQNGVSTIINYVKNTAISDTTWVPQIKVNGKDSGIAHSFEITQDQFATATSTSGNSDKQLINYHNYYYVAIAYAYNGFKPFDIANSSTTQDQPYIGSAHGANGIAIPVVVGLPNPTNGALGTVVNSDWGSGVAVTRIEGQGNGGNAVQLDPTSEAAIIQNNSVDSALYLTSQGPIDVKVIDPMSVPDYKWALQITSGYTTAGNLSDTGSWTLCAYDQSGNLKDIVYSEETIQTPNEQIIDQYGISVAIKQVVAPGTNQATGNGYITSSITFEDQSQPWLWGVQDQADSNFANWLRSGNNQGFKTTQTATSPCNFNDYTKLDINQDYENLLSNFSPTQSTWGPYVLAAAFATSAQHYGTGTQCGFEVAYSPTYQDSIHFTQLPDVNIVLTSDIKQWTRCAVVEEQEDPTLSQDHVQKFFLRGHASWNSEVDANGYPVYSETASDTGMSYFPGYAIDEGTGQRLNIVFGEDSWLGSDNGRDMLWNPTSNQFNSYDGSIIFGGKHIVYILGTKYDKDSAFVAVAKKATGFNTNLTQVYGNVRWVGVPTLNPASHLLPLTSSGGLIPTTTTLKFRVTRPYAPYEGVDTSTLTAPAGITLKTGKKSNPLYSFSTESLAPSVLSDSTDRSELLSKIYAVPNPYYGYSGYESNRFDTKVRIINLPAQATIYIYSLDGSLIRTLTKNDPTTPYIDWDIRNTVGLPIASGMYLMDVHANGIGETVIKWFGATRPIDVTTY